MKNQFSGRRSTGEKFFCSKIFSACFWHDISQPQSFWACFSDIKILRYPWFHHLPQFGQLCLETKLIYIRIAWHKFLVLMIVKILLVLILKMRFQWNKYLTEWVHVNPDLRDPMRPHAGSPRIAAYQCVPARAKISCYLRISLILGVKMLSYRIRFYRTKKLQIWFIFYRDSEFFSSWKFQPRCLSSLDQYACCMEGDIVSQCQYGKYQPYKN